MTVQVTSRGPEKESAITSGNRKGRRMGSGENYEQEKGAGKG